ncbi:MAG TPA: hypothetical protein VJN22_07730, partial [Candidatus Eremiobacteraceae bacterium]|nr:hypothetical protein [Candidatus Eremiobacteraceae bacterium]
AKAHVDALRELGTFKSIRIWGREPAKSAALAANFSTGTMRVTAASSIAEACRGAEVVCTVTASAEPILGADDVEAGAHINAVGACTPRARELAADLVSTSRIVCDSREGAMTEAGDILLAIADGALQAPPHIALLGDVLTGKTEGRRSGDEITLFESLGVAIEDLACAELVFDRATAQGIGVTVDI